MGKLLRGVWSYKMQTKKGFILIYTLLIGIICLFMMMYIFDIQVSQIKYSTSTKKYLLKEDIYQKNKEYLLTLFYSFITENNDQITEKGVTNFFCDFKNIVKYGTASVNYSNKTNEFVFITPYEYRVNRNDYFKLEVSGGSFNISFIRTDYTNN